MLTLLFTVLKNPVKGIIDGNRMMTAGFSLSKSPLLVLALLFLDFWTMSVFIHVVCCMFGCCDDFVLYFISIFFTFILFILM